MLKSKTYCTCSYWIILSVYVNVLPVQLLDHIVSICQCAVIGSYCQYMSMCSQCLKKGRSKSNKDVLIAKLKRSEPVERNDRQQKKSLKKCARVGSTVIMFNSMLLCKFIFILLCVLLK